MSNPPWSVDAVVSLLPAKAASVGTLAISRGMDGEVLQIPIRTPGQKASVLKERLPNLLSPLRQLIGVKQLQLTDSELLRANTHLDRLAYGMLEELLSDTASVPENVMAELAEFLAPVFSSAAPTGRLPVIEIEATSSDRLAWLLPFELFPLAPELHETGELRERFERFLGFRAQIVRHLRGGPDRIVLSPSGRLTMHLIASTGQDLPGIKRQCTFLKERCLIFAEWPGQVAITDTVGQLADCLVAVDNGGSGMSVRAAVHFSCHYSQSAEPELVFYQTKNDSMQVRVIELAGEISRRRVLDDPRRPFQTLYFLNACSSGSLRTEGTTLMSVFQRRGAAALIGSETLMPDRLAGEFAVGFYEALLANQTLSLSVSKARRRLLELYGNPVGLFYTFYGNPNLTVATE